MTKDQILSEIRRTAKANGNVPLGFRQFRTTTGIQDNEWLGRYWARWGDAVREAGFTPNTKQAPFDEVVLLENYISLLREVGKIPAIPEFNLKKRSDPKFPAWCVFQRRFGPKPQLVARVAEYCKGKEDYIDILAYCESFLESRSAEAIDSPSESKCGYVYLIKHGNRREYKIGKTFNPIRREGEIILQLPDKIHPLHYIKTDDPSGVETYWHNRFAAKRKEGEWFELSLSDVKAFKRWKRIY
jgi:hypothetical protein